MGYKLYPRYINGVFEPFTEEDIKKNRYWLFMDYECPCGKVQAVSNMGGQGEPCISCGQPSLSQILLDKD